MGANEVQHPVQEVGRNSKSALPRWFHVSSIMAHFAYLMARCANLFLNSSLYSTPIRAAYAVRDSRRMAHFANHYLDIFIGQQRSIF
jgi:hypothetical protein